MPVRIYGIYNSCFQSNCDGKKLSVTFVESINRQLLKSTRIVCELCNLNEFYFCAVVHRVVKILEKNIANSGLTRITQMIFVFSKDEACGVNPNLRS